MRSTDSIPSCSIAGKEVPGKSALSVTRGGFIYLFSTAETKATFEGDPGKYEIQLGGLCARMGKTAGGNPADFLVHDGKIYVFGSDACHKKFAAAPAKFLAPAPDPMPSSHSSNSQSAPAARSRRRGDRRRWPHRWAEQLRRILLPSSIPASGRRGRRHKNDLEFPGSRSPGTDNDHAGKASSSATILSPQGMWFVSGQGRAISDSGRGSAQSRTGVRAAPRRSLAPSTRSRLQSVRARPGSVGEATVENVRVRSGSVDVTLGIGASGRIHSATFHDRNAEGEVGIRTIVYTDFRAVEGMQLPYAIRSTFDGALEPQQSVTLDAIALNAATDPALFMPNSQAKR